MRRQTRDCQLPIQELEGGVDLEQDKFPEQRILGMETLCIRRITRTPHTVERREAQPKRTTSEINLTQSAVFMEMYQLILKVVFKAVNNAARKRTGLIFLVSFEMKVCSA